jgi:hypothetical protein
MHEYEECAQVVAIEIAKGYYPAITIAEAKGPHGNEGIAREAWGRERSECGGRRGKEGEDCEEEEDGEAL